MSIYVSIDIETTGKDPSRNAILSIGACAMRVDGVNASVPLSDFYVNMTMPPSRVWDRDTQEWWDQQSAEAQGALKVAPIHSYRDGIRAFLKWMNSGLPRKIVNRSGPETPDMGPEPINMLFYPASFDYRFLTRYVTDFIETDFADDRLLRDFWFLHRRTTVIDLQTMAMTLMQVEGHQARRSNWPKAWRAGEEGKVLHNALDDAQIQMGYFLAMREWAYVNNKECE